MTSSPRAPQVVIAITLAKPGGATTFVLGLAESLHTQGIPVTVLAGEGEWLFEQCAKKQIPCLLIPSLGRELSPWNDLRSLYQLASLLKKLQPTALHLNSSKMGVLGSLAGRLACVPRIIYCIGGWSFLEAVSQHKKALYIWAERISSCLKDHIVCVHPGDAELARVHHIRGREETLVIPNGVDVCSLDESRLSRTAARTALGFSQDEYLFGTLGNFYPAKDLPRYMEACAIVHREHPTARFVLIGDGQERGAIESARSRYGLDRAVVLLGSIDQASRYLSAFDSFVFPSAKEGMAFALLEAMAARLPCIVTDVGANRWVLGEDAWIVPPQNPQALASAMKEAFLSPEEAIKKGLRARETVENRFPLQQTFAAHIALLT